MDIKRTLVVLLCFVLGGCTPPTVYRLAVTPDGDGMRRELAVVNGGELEEMLGTIFPVPVIEDGVSRYSGRFDGVPKDIGGSGTWHRVTSPMGSVYLYAERFRGDDDLVGQVEARLLAMDRMVDLLIAWFESELSDDAGWPVLRGFMDTQFRHDMKNLSLYIFELDRQGQTQEQWGPAYFARVGQYLIDRGYFGDDDLVGLMRLFGPSGEGSDDLLRRAVARRMGLEAGGDIPASLGFLGLSGKAILDSWEKFAASAACAELVGGWGLPESSEKGGVDSAVSAVLLSAAGIEFELFESPDEVELTLDNGVEPIATNGVWDAEAKRVTWSGQVRERYGLPLFFYAYWAQPETAYQETYLGGVILEGKPLAEMVAWYAGLSVEARQRWDRFVGSLDPTESIREQVKAFRTAGGGSDADPLGRGCGYLLSVLPAESE